MSRRGFTLIELVIVILLTGILAAFAVPKLLGKGGVETQTVRDELVARLRLIQTANMNEPTVRCSQLVVEPTQFAHRTQAISGANCPAAGSIASWDSDTRSRGRIVATTASTTFSLGSKTSFAIRFDLMGRPLGDCAGGCVLQVNNGTEISRIRIESEGYIHEIP